MLKNSFYDINSWYINNESEVKKDDMEREILRRGVAEPDISEDGDPSAYDIEIDDRIFNDRETDEQSDALPKEKKSGKIKKILKKFFKVVGIIILILFILLVLILII